MSALVCIGVCSSENADYYIIIESNQSDLETEQTFPGIMELPGSFSGKLSSPNPHLGPEPRSLISLAIFMREHATVFKAPLTSTNASWAAKPGKTKEYHQ